MLKAGAILVAGVLAGALFVVLRPDGADDEASPGSAASTEAGGNVATGDGATTAPVAAPQLTRINIEVRGGSPVGGVARVEVERGRRIELVVRSDAADHVHVHGHDLVADVGPGQPASFRFRATIPGRIEVELEDTHTLVAELSVGP